MDPDPDPDSDQIPDPTPFFIDFKDANKNYYFLHIFFSFKTFLRKGKDPKLDPDPHL